MSAGKLSGVGYTLFHVAHLPDGSIYENQSSDSYYPHDKITETDLASATASYQEALNRQRDLVKLQQRHAQIMDQFFADKEQAYIKFQAWADDRFAAIQTHTENIERSQAEIQALIDEFETLRQETQASLDAALAEIETAPTSASGS